jgi:hypothetical protein
MRRLPKSQRKLPSSKGQEPDFYALDKQSPLPSLEDAPILALASAMRAKHENQRQQQNGCQDSIVPNRNIGPSMSQTNHCLEPYKIDDSYFDSYDNGDYGNANVVTPLHVQSRCSAFNFSATLDGSAPETYSNNLEAYTSEYRTCVSPTSNIPLVSEDYQAFDAHYLSSHNVLQNQPQQMQDLSSRGDSMSLSSSYHDNRSSFMQEVHQYTPPLSVTYQRHELLPMEQQLMLSQSNLYSTHCLTKMPPMQHLVDDSYRTAFQTPYRPPDFYISNPTPMFPSSSMIMMTPPQTTSDCLDSSMNGSMRSLANNVNTSLGCVTSRLI